MIKKIPKTAKIEAPEPVNAATGLTYAQMVKGRKLLVKMRDNFAKKPERLIDMNTACGAVPDKPRNERERSGCVTYHAEADGVGSNLETFKGLQYGITDGEARSVFGSCAFIPPKGPGIKKRVLAKLDEILTEQFYRLKGFWVPAKKSKAKAKVKAKPKPKAKAKAKAKAKPKRKPKAAPSRRR